MATAAGYATGVSVHTARAVAWTDLLESLGAPDAVVAAATVAGGPSQPDKLLYTFSGVQIPTGATITSATVTLRRAETQQGSATILISIGGDTNFDGMAGTTLADATSVFLSSTVATVNAGVIIEVGSLQAKEVVIDSIHLSVEYTAPPAPTHVQRVARPASYSAARSAARRPTAI